MARGSDQATGAATTGQNLANQYSGQATAIGSNLIPTLTAQAANPQGMSPLDIARTDTASMQSAGGSQGAAVGQGMLRAARTRNAGGADAAIADSTRTAGEKLSSDALNTRLKNASLKMTQRDDALKGLGSLYGENVVGGNAALAQVAPNVNANTNAVNSSWDWAKDLAVPLLGIASKSIPTRSSASSGAGSSGSGGSGSTGGSGGGGTDPFGNNSGDIFGPPGSGGGGVDSSLTGLPDTAVDTSISYPTDNSGGGDPYSPEARLRRANNSRGVTA